ncbi:30S ribosome-binding factor RbfA [Pseudomonas sp. 21LCFQ02]|uniref:30S ribosome-binding factor RbfA n=1 Tax=unclassified Pseudomonas TaxID=196821 RepID=UPI0004F8648C|nr:MULTISPECIES: 30S ribosome-binding factor RbfA [unclassified Pseudomonas]MCO8166709.1 30S ribosome-binding factor RbfA [Pseudomonas sp. 21LCFQ02]MCQ9424203.1 30S ribosome-binding factor RbfA [Pseudomonas sp. LJDD11]BAP43454.1 ribosome-binding factor A [Pseudomonas sp. StFLB209]
MAKEYSRTQRIGDQMQRELAQLIRREVKDPRLGLVTITAVDVSRDLSHAQVYVTVMGQDGNDEVAQSIKVLNTAAGFLRMQIGREMKLRTVPQLHFRYDESVSRGAHLSALIERAVAEDSQHQPGSASDDSKE